MPWLQLIRWKNLVIIFLTQLLVWVCVILPASPKVLTLVNFLCISVSTLLIAAAGYIINDYFDIKIDLINKPGKVILEKTIPRKQAIILHTVLNIIALVLAAYVALKAHHIEWLLVQVSCTLLLWFYSTDFKRQYITGNIAISLLTAFTILVLVIYEPGILRSNKLPGLSLPGWLLIVYSYFAFMLTWMREIVKDMEDYKGDAAEGCVTMPVKRGLGYAANYIIVLAALVIMLLAFAAFMLYRFSIFSLAVYVLVLIIALVLWCIFLNKAATSPHYHKASQQLKIIMLLGICSLIIYHFQFLS